MDLRNSIRLALVATLFSFAAIAVAQDSTDDAAEVILVIEEQWEANQEGDDDWIDELLHDSFSAWENGTPAPRNKASTRMWTRFMSEQGQMVEHELYFQNIVIHGDTAVAHYFFTRAFQDKDDDVKISSGRYTDVLVRTEDGWKFIAWHGGDAE